MRRLTLIRHGLTDWNASGRFQGHIDRPLSDDGREQARCLREHVADSPVDLVASSPLVRARETAEIAFPGHPLHLDPRLKELHFGLFEGRTQSENEALEEWAWWYEDPFERRAPGGESYRELRERAVAWLLDLPDVPHVVAVTHSGVIQMLVAWVIGAEHPRWRKRIYLRHSGITRLLFRGEDMVIERVNDTRHLPSNGFDPFLD